MKCNVWIVHLNGRVGQVPVHSLLLTHTFSSFIEVINFLQLFCDGGNGKPLDFYSFKCRCFSETRLAVFSGDSILVYK